MVGRGRGAGGARKRVAQRVAAAATAEVQGESSATAGKDDKDTAVKEEENAVEGGDAIMEEGDLETGTETEEALEGESGVENVEDPENEMDELLGGEYVELDEENAATEAERDGAENDVDESQEETELQEMFDEEKDVVDQSDENAGDHGEEVEEGMDEERVAEEEIYEGDGGEDDRNEEGEPEYSMDDDADISWVEELWNMKEAEKSGTDAEKNSKETKGKAGNAQDQKNASGKAVEGGSTDKDQHREKDTVKKIFDPENLTPEEKLVYKRKRFYRLYGVPLLFSGPFFDKTYFQYCIRVSPVVYHDVRQPGFTETFAIVHSMRFVNENKQNFLELLVTGGKMAKIMEKLLFTSISGNNIKVEVERRKHTPDTKKEKEKFTTMQAYGELTNRVTFKQKNALTRRTLMNPDINGPRGKTAKERSLFLHNLPPSVDEDFLRILFPCSLEIGLVKVSDDISSAVLQMRNRDIAYNHLVCFTDYFIDGRDIQMGIDDMSQEDALKKYEETKAAAVKKNVSTKETVKSHGSKTSSATDAKGSEAKNKSPDKKSKEQTSSRSSSQKGSKLDGKEEQEKREKERRDRERRDRDRREDERRDRRERDQRDKSQADRERQRRAEQSGGRLHRPEHSRRDERFRGHDYGRNPGRFQPDLERQRQRQLEMEREREFELQQREMERQRELQQELERQREMERLRQEEHEKRQYLEMVQRQQMEELQRQKMKRQERERQERQERLLRQEQERQRQAREEAARKLKLMEEEQVRRERQERQRQEAEARREREERERARERMQQQQQQQQRKQRWSGAGADEQQPRKRSRFDAQHTDMQPEGHFGGYAGGPRGAGPAGGSPVPGRGHQKVEVQQTLEEQVARQAEELKRNLALLEEFQKAPTRMAANLAKIDPLLAAATKGDRREGRASQQQYYNMESREDEGFGGQGIKDYDSLFHSYEQELNQPQQQTHHHQQQQQGHHGRGGQPKRQSYPPAATGRGRGRGGGFQGQRQHQEPAQTEYQQAGLLGHRPSAAFQMDADSEGGRRGQYDRGNAHGPSGQRLMAGGQEEGPLFPAAQSMHEDRHRPGKFGYQHQQHQGYDYGYEDRSGGGKGYSQDY